MALSSMWPHVHPASGLGHAHVDATPGGGFEEGATPMPKEAHLTGESLTIYGNTLYNNYCPECNGPQWHGQGHTTCIYCDAAYDVHVFKVIPAQVPEKEK